ncbi:hypothetical protein Pan54_07540 [Rubinisphaera italica]|uniref:Uncharacterized protein n=1 Tax=Rubinisphaera italica TaxID=2527969 RepID=A0A5C5XDP7_9PLAN|nr:hypothetical protein Pan54_07540 [Rubinisphaera italica]
MQCVRKSFFILFHSGYTLLGGRLKRLDYGNRLPFIGERSVNESEWSKSVKI